MADRGTYSLHIQLPETVTQDIGSVGSMTFEAGWYAYTGSAFGPGGFSRIKRHQDVAAGRTDTRHWHIDYLLGDTPARIVGDHRSAGYAIECAVNRAISGQPVTGFGASDCQCGSHLQYHVTRIGLEAAVETAHATARAAADTSAD